MDPLAYFLTFHTYGSWLHGRGPGSVDRDHNQPGSPFLPTDAEMELLRRERMTQPPYLMDRARRTVVLDSLRQHCAFRGWTCHALHVRANHVHIVATCTKSPEQVMTEFKAYASRALTAAGHDTADRKRWARHGSTRWLNDEASLAAAIRYTVDRQGEAMSVFESGKG